MKKLEIKNFNVKELKIEDQKIVNGGGFGPFNSGINLALRLFGTFNRYGKDDRYNSLNMV
ncbi:hypothetical protein ACFOG5_07835 [Pedobacter fastidiosus]|uniref:Bacteriocin-type signal sequence-containing protein n=1 Tax=Pedobacter fastidiosus TaxID=2765361 RepID=A0ABR7KPB9_9SPHI|nr:hypothetical protein [Pedobacter fastidiosus]MBC6109934.1 hypothetical protein [Pedobacter fastidiosus]